MDLLEALWMDISDTMAQLTLKAWGHVWTNKQALRLQNQLLGTINNPHQLAWLSTRRKAWTMGWGRRWECVLVEGVRGRG